MYGRLYVACLLLAGCSGQGPNVVLDTPTGTAPIYTPALAPPGMPGGAIGAPPGMDNPAQAQAPAFNGDRSGNYAGTAVPLDTGGGICINTERVINFRVHGNRASFGRFRGTIDANGGLQMPNGQDWIVGQFDGASFHGQLDLNARGRFGGEGCTYMLSLERVQH